VGGRPITVTPRRTKPDFASRRQERVAVHFPTAEKRRGVLDNLSPHTPGALYDVLPPADARRSLRPLEFPRPPGHGSWRTMAEGALAVWARQGLTRRVPDRATGTREPAAWQARRNHRQASLDWRFTTGDARITWKRLSPKASR
jgi:hypothetical protein